MIKLCHIKAVFRIGIYNVNQTFKVFIELLLLISKGRAIGGGDVKLMAAAGLLLGWKGIILAFVIGCIVGSVIHMIRIKVSHASHVLALGPYLAVGIFAAALWGETMIAAYLNLLMG